MIHSTKLVFIEVKFKSKIRLYGLLETLKTMQISGREGRKHLIYQGIFYAISMVWDAAKASRCSEVDIKAIHFIPYSNWNA